MSVTAVLADAWALYRRSFGRYVAIAAAAFVVLHLVSIALAEGAADTEGATLALWTGLGAIVVLGSFVAYAALVHGGREGAGTASAVGEAYGATARRLGPLLAAAVVSSLGIALGFLLLIVPGLYLATRWSLVFQAMMLEQAPWRAAFRRSAELVRGHGWTMLGLVVVTFVASGVAILLPGAAERWLPLPDLLSGWVVGATADSLAFPYFALLFNAAYARLTPTAPRPAPA